MESAVLNMLTPVQQRILVSALLQENNFCCTHQGHYLPAGSKECILLDYIQNVQNLTELSSLLIEVTTYTSAGVSH